jgi:hypothetical protein
MTEIKREDFKDVVCQASLFFPNSEIITYKILSNLISNWPVFDAHHEILPDVPKSVNLKVNVPTLILKSKSEEWRFEFSPTRMNFFHNRLVDNKNDFRVENFPAIAAPYLKSVLDLFQPKVGRLAFVLRRYLKAENPGEILARHFCKEEFLSNKALNRSKNFELHSHKEYQPSGLPMINSWFRCKTADLKFGPETFRTIFIEHDFNTLDDPKEKNEFTWDEVQGFYSLLVSEAQNVLGKFFPEKNAVKK